MENISNFISEKIYSNMEDDNANRVYYNTSSDIFDTAHENIMQKITIIDFTDIGLFIFID